MDNLFQKLYRIIFWIGYFTVLVISLIPLKRINFDKIIIESQVFYLRLDHFLHFSAYFLICVYYLIGWLKGFSLFYPSSLWRFFILVLILAVVSELVQLWVPDRAFNVFDMLANVLGLILGIIFIKMVPKRYYSAF